MPNKSGAIRAGRAFVEAFLDDNPLKRGLKAAEARLRAFGATVKAIGLSFLAAGSAIVAPLVAASKTFASIGDQIQKMSARTGFSAESLSTLGFAAQQSGANIDQLDKSLAAMARFTLQADRGLASATELLDMLGISAEQLQGLKPEDKFYLLAEAISKVPDPTKKAGIALAVFGRSGRELLPMLENGAAGIKELQDEARALGLEMSGKDADAAAAFTDAMGRLWSQTKMAVFQLGAAVGPALSQMLANIKPMISGFLDWLKVNRGIVLSLFKVGGLVIAAGTAFYLLGQAISVAGAAIGATSLILGGISTAVSVLLSPVGLLVTAIGAVAYSFLNLTETGKEVLAWLSDSFSGLVDVARTTLGGIADALKAGNLGLAAKIGMKGLQTVVEMGLNYAQEKFIEFKIGVLEVWGQLTSNLKKMWTKTVGGLSELIIVGLGKIEGASAEEIQQRISINTDITNQKLSGIPDPKDNSALEALRKKRDELRAANKEEIDGLRAELTGLAAQAKAENQKKAADLASGQGGRPGFLDNIDLGLNQSQSRASAASTFSVFGVNALSGERNKAQEQTSKNTKDIAEILQRMENDSKAREMLGGGGEVAFA